MDKIKALEAFVAVVDTGGFTRAADLLNAPKATMSTLVQELETQLGVRLLHRTTRKVTVTADGAAYYERCRRILDDLREADESVSPRQGLPSGRLRVDVPTSMASFLMFTGMSDFLTRYPDISLEMGCSDRVVNMVTEGVDCVIRVGDVSDPTLVARRIGSMQFKTCAARSYVDAHGLPGHPDELRKHRWVNYFMPGRVAATWDFAKDGQRIELQPEGGLSVNDSNVYEDAVLAGLGIGQLPSFTFECACRAGELVAVLPDWTTDPLPVHVLFPSNRHLSTKVQAFVEWMAEFFEKTPGLRRV
ncbi:MAG: LysR family transcriptional regulator [Pseudomonadota bacterium]